MYTLAIEKHDQLLEFWHEDYATISTLLWMMLGDPGITGWWKLTYIREVTNGRSGTL